MEISFFINEESYSVFQKGRQSRAAENTGQVTLAGGDCVSSGHLSRRDRSCADSLSFCWWMNGIYSGII